MDVAIEAAKHLPDDGKPESITLCFMWIKAVEEFEDFFLMFGGDANAIVFDAIDTPAPLGETRYLNDGRALRGMVFKGVAYKVGKDLRQLNGVSLTGR